MINHLDNLLRHLFISRIDEITDEAQVRFQPPDDTWRQYVSNLTVSGTPANAINVYLADVRENRRLRSNERLRTFENSNVKEEPTPVRIDCHYLITAWSPAGASPAVEPALDEHALLYEVIGILMKYEALIPSKVYDPDPLPATFPEPVADAELPTAILPVEGFPKIAEFWGSVEWRWKPMVYYVVTLPVILDAHIAGPMVTTRITEYRIKDKPETAEKWIQIGGTVYEAANPANLIEGAEVRLLERNRSTKTDARGRFTFSALIAGNYTLEVYKTGFAIQSKNIVVPGKSPDAYDIALQHS